MSFRQKKPLVPREIRGERLPNGIRFLTTSSNDAQAAKTHCQSPVFLLSAGWRSGSTLLQRLICSDETTLMWGEPFGDRIPICRLASTVQDFCENDDHLKYAITNFNGTLSDEWIANLNPGLDTLRAAHLAFFETLFAKPAASRGYAHWGVKWVRLSGFHAWYLKWLYPQSKIVFLVRHPLNSYRSYRGKRWFSIKPDYCVNGIFRFMGHWRYLASSFLNEQKSLEAFLVRYEDLVGKKETLHALSDYLGFNLDDSLLDRPVGARSKKQRNATWRERAICYWMTRQACRQYEYSAATPHQGTEDQVQPVSTVTLNG